MTCIVGLEHKGTVWMGGDSAGTNMRMDQTSRADKKVFIRGDFIMGFAGSFRMGQLLNHGLKIPVQKPGQSDDQFLVTDFVAAVKECLAKEGLEPYFLFGYKGKLYDMQGDYQVGKPNSKFASIGSGRDLALGAMHASKNVRNPKKRLTDALEAAAAGNAAVRAPFIILKK